MIALNSPFRDFQRNPAAILQAVRKHVMFRRTDANVTVACQESHLTECHIFKLSINGKESWRTIRDYESVWRAVNEMIDELWPLELMP